MFRALKWLYPGMRVKRWLLVIIFGILLACLGTAAATFGLLGHWSQGYGWAGVFFLLSAFFVVTGVYRLMRSLAELLWRRDREKDLVDVAFERRYLGLGPRVVALGGGTGMSILLEGLKEYTAQVTAIVSVADDGGSSGRLRRELDMLPPGDIRKCLVALSGDSTMLGELLRYRFTDADAPRKPTAEREAGAGGNGGGAGESASGSTELAGHSFGNLFLTVLWRLTGDFAEGVRQAGRILGIRGRVIPATLDRLSLVATYEDGSTTVGQRRISESTKRIRRVELSPKPPPASADIVDAIARADLVVVGPGSLYTSVLPNLLIEGVPEAIRRSGAVKVYVASIVSHEGETRGYGLRDYLDAFREHVGPAPFDLVLVNSSGVPEAALKELAERGRPKEAEGSEGAGPRANGDGGAAGTPGSSLLRTEGALLVRYSPSELGKDGGEGPGGEGPSAEGNLRFVEADIASSTYKSESALRHDPKKLARTLMTILAEERDRE